MGYKVIGKVLHDDKVFNHGDSISASDVGGDEEFDKLVTAKSVVEDDEFKSLYPDAEEGTVVQASGTPSNLHPVEGTELQAPDQGAKEEQSKAAAPQPRNPADPPKVKDAGTPKAADKDQQSKA
jgi:hypothetical protein